MTYLLGIFQTIGVHTLLGLSAYLLLLTGQLGLAQVVSLLLELMFQVF